MPEQKYIKPAFIGTEDSIIGEDGAMPLPETWKAFVNFDAEAFWKEQDRAARRRARLEACEFADDDIPDDSRFTLPGYDPDDFTKDR
jgi:hypothetical protein